MLAILALLLAILQFSFSFTALNAPQHRKMTHGARWKWLSRSALPDGKSANVIQAEGSGSPCRIKVIGVGGGGGNAVNRMMESGTAVLGVEMWTVNTDAQALSRSLAPNKLNIGATTSR